MANLRAQRRDGGLDVSWMRPQNFSNVELELISGYSVRWCPLESAGSVSGSPSKCTSIDVSPNVQSYHINGLEAGVTYYVSVKVKTRFANENWASIVTSSALKLSADGMSSPLLLNRSAHYRALVLFAGRVGDERLVAARSVAAAAAAGRLVGCAGLHGRHTGGRPALCRAARRRLVRHALRAQAPRAARRAAVQLPRSSDVCAL